MKIKVKPGQRLYGDGAIYLEGDVVDLPAAEARHWIADGRASEVTEKDTKSDK